MRAQNQRLLKVTKAKFAGRLAPIVIGLSLLVAPGMALAEPRDHSGHKSPLGHPPCAECDLDAQHDRTERPFETGQGTFAAMQEMVMLLEGKTDTDWAKFNLDRLYTHLIDMNEISLNTTVETQDLDDGLAMSLTGAPRTLEALLRVIPDQAITLGRINAWESAVEVEADRVVLTLTSDIEEEVRHMKALGFFGLMAAGSGHHQPFHLALARGETEGVWPRAEYLTVAAKSTSSEMDPKMEADQPMSHMGKQMGGEQPMNHMDQMEGGHLADDKPEGGQVSAAGHRPYAGMQTRTIKALSENETDGLMSGKGIGYALAAELNHYPGPRHALDLAAELDLNPEQLANTQAVFNAMELDAISLGKAIVDKEGALDTAFATGDIDRTGLETLVHEIAQLEGRLRTVHLSTHLEMKSILTPAQVVLYDQMRGYAPSVAPGMVHETSQ